MPQPITVVDAFTDRPFAGNPAAVCLLPAPAPEAWMQQVAREMNLAETAFLVAREDGYALRWFTPALEVDLCGHATLASAHALWEEDHAPAGTTIRFHTRSGLLTAHREDEWIVLDFPATPATPADPPPELQGALGLSSLRWMGRNAFDYLVEVDSEAVVRGLQPDLATLARFGARGVIVTARGESGRPYDFVSRFFAPGAGIPEDPVTGSAHCTLASYWRPVIGRDRMTGYQASPRGGTVRVTLAGNRVHLGGRAVTVWRGTLLHPPGSGG